MSKKVVLPSKEKIKEAMDEKHRGDIKYIGRLQVLVESGNFPDMPFSKEEFLKAIKETKERLIKTK